MKIPLWSLRWWTCLALWVHIATAFQVSPALIRSQSPSFQLLVQKMTTTTMHDFSSQDPDELFENAVGRGWRPPKGTFAGLRRVTSSVNSITQRQMLDTNGAVMPDGGVSPCIIKVIGVGGGGCNAVR